MSYFGERQLSRLRRTLSAQQNSDGLHIEDTRRVSPTGCSKRPSSKTAASEEARRTLRYVEPLSEARTPLADFFSILLETEPDAKEDVLGAKVQRELLPVVVGREVLVLAEQKHTFGQIALHSAKELRAECP